MARFPEVYRRAEWDQVREYVIARVHGLCEECTRQGRIEAGRDVDHIVPLTAANKDDWNIAYNPDNLQLLCKDCHDRKHGRTSGLHAFVMPVGESPPVQSITP